MKSKEWLILNAVECWLHYYSTPNTPTVEQYKELRDEYKQLIDVPPPQPKTTRKRSSTKSSDDPSSTTETV
jgi:hypothetical protein